MSSAAAAATLGLGTAWIVAQAPQVTTLQLPEPLRLVAAVAADVDGDGLDDLVLVGHDEVGKRRELRLHRRAAASPLFTGEPTSPPYALERDVVGFAFADVEPRPGRELVLFTAERAVLVLPVPGAQPEYRPLFAHELLWPAADPRDAVDFGFAVRDVDGDGLADFVLPEADGARVVRQRRGPDGVAFAAPEIWRLPARVGPLAGTAAGGGDLRLRFELGGDGRDDDSDGPLVEVRTRVPLFHFADLDGDGVHEGVALRNDALWVWPTRAGGGERPAGRRVPLPLPADRLTLFDPVFDVQLVDGDGDRRADLLLATAAARDDDVEVRLDWFRSGEAPEWATKPDCRLRVRALAGVPQLVDADGDGQLDLVAVTVRTDTLRGLTGDGPTSLEGQLNLFRGDGKQFVTPAALNHVLQVPAGRRGPRSPFVHVLPGQAGRPGALLFRGEEHVVLQPLARDGEVLRLLPPRWRVPLAATARPQRPTAAGEFVVLDDRELLHVRWQ